jgi:hypothetical protein
MEPRFQAIDLRWGVAREAALDQQTMNICIQELKRCQELSPKPNFIILAGDRYGWIPLPPQIEANEFEQLLAQMSDEERELLLGDLDIDAWVDGHRNQRNGWYRKDENADPGEFVLQPRTIRFTTDVDAESRKRIQQAESADWARIENRLSKRLAEAIEKSGWSPDDPRRQKFERSATHQEIDHGAFAVTNVEEHVLCYFRTIAGLPEDVSAKGFRDLNEHGSVDTVAQNRLDHLKSDLVARIPEEHRFSYPINWESVTDVSLTGVSEGDEPTPDPDLKEFCDRVESDLRRIIDRELQSFRQETEIAREARLHSEFTEQHTARFVGRTDVLEDIKSYCAGDSLHPLIISGVSGSGKTALLAKATEMMESEQPAAQTIRRFVGATPGSTELRTLLSGLCNALGTGELAQETSELSREFIKRLEAAAATRPVYIFLDALDQLSPSDNSHSLWWFPRNLPAGAKLIATVLDREDESGECHRSAKRMFPDSIISLAEMNEADGRALLNLWLSDAARRLQPAQEQIVLDGFRKSPYPLYLRAAFDDAKRWKSWDTSQIMGVNVEGLLRNLFARLSRPQHHGNMMVQRCLGYLAAARRGLTEDELLDVLSRDQDVLNEFHQRSPDSPATDRLPIVIWSRLYADLKENLIQRQAYGAAVISFYHRQVREAVEREFLPSESARVQAHQQLAAFFREQDYWRESLEEQRARARRLPPTPRPANIRKVDELPYHVLEIAKLAGKDDATSPHWDAVADLLTDWQFLEAKAEAQPFAEEKEQSQTQEAL